MNSCRDNVGLRMIFDISVLNGESSEIDIFGKENSKLSVGKTRRLFPEKIAAALEI